ncbi:MAG: FeoB-associated Cys-rich membrane protein [Lachnospiraceae bacterium]|nr:FeoB-associated Cys-rich membrane protein [Lachnospiraceae bacterium]
MIQFITANIGTIVIALVVAGIVAAIIVSIVRDKKKGKSSCGCGCENCAMKGQCHTKG